MATPVHHAAALAARSALLAKHPVVQAPQRPPHSGRHHRDRQRRRGFGRQGPAQRLRGLRQITDQAHDVVRDGRYRQPFHGGLHLQLQILPVVHRGEQRLAALLLLDFHPRAQQVAHARDPLRERILPPGGPCTGAACGREAPVHELADGLHARQAGFGNVLDAAVQQLEVGAARLERDTVR